MRHSREMEEERSLGMKKLTLLSLIGITSIALTQPGWAAGHGGGGGGGFHGGGFGGGHFGGGGFGAPHISYGGVGNRGGGVRFGMRLDLTVTAALAIEAETATLFFKHSVLFEDDLTIRDPTGDLVERFGNEQ